LKSNFYRLDMMLTTLRACAVCAMNYFVKEETTASLRIHESSCHGWLPTGNCKTDAPLPNDFVEAALAVASAGCQNGVK
jgi:hypothetical protein